MLPRSRMNKTQQTMWAAGALAVGAALIARGLRASRAMDFRGRSILVAGGSRGLGLLVARDLGLEGARLTIAARDEAELGRARDYLSDRGIRDVTTIACDVGVREEAERLIASTLDRAGAIDVLINMAGVIQVGPIEHMQRTDFEQALAVHFWGPLHMIMSAIPAMRRQGGGRIVNVSSIGGKVGVPHLVPYCASKFALTGLSDSIRAELVKDNIYVTTVCPGLMRTGSPYNAWFKGKHRDEFTWFTISDSIPLATIDADRAAAQLVDACRHGDAELVIGWPARLAIVANAVLPEAMALAMSAVNAMLLPQPTDGSGDRARSGWQSMSSWAPSRLTALTNRAAAENNELPQ